MSKQREVTAHYNQRGYATSGDAYNRDMRKARLADESSTHHSASVPATDYFTSSCLGCCDSNDPEEDWQDGNSSSCCIIL
ncbi:MAG: hypothetical protein AB8B68_00135 [Rickettsiaceae bacterium]